MKLLTTEEGVLNFQRDEPEVLIMDISPEVADVMLAANTKNRPLRDARVDIYADDLVNDEGVLTNDAITFDTNGTLVNGQHRLQAIIQTKKTLQALVLMGVDPNVRDTLDTGQKRTLSQTLTLQSEYPNTSNLAAAARFHRRLLLGEVRVNPRAVGGGGRDAVNHKTLIKHIADHPELHPAVTEGLRLRRHATGARAAVTGAVYACLHVVDTFKAAELLEQVLQGNDLYPGHPALAFRNYLMRLANESTPSPIQAAILIKTWNAFYEERDLYNLKVGGNERFPRISGFDGYIDRNEDEGTDDGE